MRRIITILILSVIGVVSFSSTTHAASLQIQPTLYKDIVLKKGEKSKGYVDISNPSATSQEVKLTVQRYKQIDDTGTLTFFDDETISKGIELDLDNFVLNPRDAIRVYFQLDGTILPSGDIFAAIFAKTIPEDAMVAQVVQVGTLMAITNGTPPSRAAAITALSAPLFQWGNAIDASMVIKNTAREGVATGFFPRLNVNIQPYSSRTVDGPLIFAGRSRSIDYTQKGNYFGIIRLQVKTEGGQASRWLFAITGFWRWLAPLIIFVLVLGVFILRQQRRFPSKKRP
jgi:hypothetical protein